MNSKLCPSIYNVLSVKLTSTSQTLQLKLDQVYTTPWQDPSMTEKSKYLVLPNLSLCSVAPFNSMKDRENQGPNENPGKKKLRNFDMYELK